MTIARRKLLGSLALVLWLSACSNASRDPVITVTDAWARPSPMAERAGAAYMLITNDGAADQLLSITTPLAAAVELHETKHADGMMAMSPLEALAIPANGQVELKPGGYHLMLVGLTRELQAGDTLTLTLKFEQTGELVVMAEVRDE